MAPPRLEVSNLTKRFDHLLANDRVSLRVEPGSFHALLGENGAGKSTLVKCLMGCHPADEGEIQVAGNGRRELVEVLAGQRRATAGTIEVNGKPFRPNRRAMLRHRYHVLPEEPLQNAAAPSMSVAENLALRNFDQPPVAMAGCRLHRRNLDRLLVMTAGRIVYEIAADWGGTWRATDE